MYALFFSTGLILGLLGGALGILTLVGYRIDLYQQEINKLSYELQEKDLRLVKLEDIIDKKKLLVKDVQLEVVFKGDPFDKMRLEQSIKTKLMKLIGKEVKNIDMEIMEEMIDQQIMQIDDKLYKTRLTKLLVTELVKIWVVVDPV